MERLEIVDRLVAPGESEKLAEQRVSRQTSHLQASDDADPAKLSDGEPIPFFEEYSCQPSPAESNCRR
jgi:hypothetical protein